MKVGHIYTACSITTSYKIHMILYILLASRDTPCSTADIFTYYITTGNEKMLKYNRIWKRLIKNYKDKGCFKKGSEFP